MITLFDTHFHCDPAFSPEEYCSFLPPDYRFLLMAAASDFEDSRLARSFAETVENAFFTCGVHPHSASAPGDLGRFGEFRGHPRLRAIGEIGLDYFYDFSKPEEQLPLFEYFLTLADEWELPVQIHLRDRPDRFDAYADALRLLAGHRGPADIHCFSATTGWAGKFLDLGACLGVTGMVTFKKSDNIRELLKFIPSDRLLIETDSPYLAPAPHRGKTNHPKYLVEIAEYAAELLGMDFAGFAELTANNAKRFFKL